MTVKRITNWSDLAALAEPWNALAAGMPLRTWDWLATWWKHYGTGASTSTLQADRELCVFAIYAGSQHSAVAGRPPALIGIAPWYLDRTTLKGSVLRWLGSGEVCTDHLSLICRPADAELIASEVADTLTAEWDDWDLIELSAIDVDDVPMRLLLAALEQRECVVSRTPADSCWNLELPATWNDYLAALSKSHRKQVRQLERRVLDTERASWLRVESQDDLAAAWEVLVDLHQRRRRSLGEPGCFASRPFHDFHREVAARLLDWGQLRLSWLEVDGLPIAAEYHFADSRTTYAYQGGVDPDRLAEEPGRLSTICCLRAAIDEGHHHVDFLRGDEPYKAHWRAMPQPTFDCRVVPNRRLARLRGRVLDLGDAVTDWMKQLVGQAPHVRNSTEPTIATNVSSTT